jgi:hypothetical protein
MCFISLVDMDVGLSHRRRFAAMVVVVSIWCSLFTRQGQNSHSITYEHVLERDIQRQSNLQFIFESDVRQCVNLLRMRRAPVFQLCDLFQARGLLRDTINSTIEEQMVMFLNVVGHNQRILDHIMLVSTYCNLML